MEHLKKSMMVMDGWGNLFTGSGIKGIDPSKGAQYQKADNLSESELIDLYSGNGVAARIVDLIVDESLRKGFYISGDEKRYIMQEMERLKFVPQLAKLLKYSRAYGGAVMVFGAADGSESLKEPLNTGAIKKVGWLRVYDRFRVLPNDIDNQLTSPRYNMPLNYQITPVTGSPFVCHYSRAIIKDGVDCHDLLRQLNQGWGQSFLQRLNEELGDYGSSLNAVSQILNAYVQDVVKIQGLHALIANNDEDVVKKRIHYIDLGKSQINTILLDALEEFQRVISSISGVPEAIDRLMINIAAIANIPASKLWGRSPAGLNSTGEGDEINWKNDVTAYQTLEVAPIVEQFVSLLYMQESAKGKEPNDWVVTFHPLRQKTEMETAAIYKTVSEADDINIRNGVLDPLDVAQKRFSGTEYNADNLANIEVDKKRFDDNELEE